MLFICDFCGKEFIRTKSDDSYIKENRLSKEDACKNCSSLKTKKTVLELYGVESVFSIKTIFEKSENTRLEKYGVKNPFCSKEIQEKIKETNLKKYGTEYIGSSEEIRERIKQTNLEKYGVENQFELPEVQEKIKQTNLKKYGVEWYTQTEEYNERVKESWLEKYGVDHPMKNAEFIKQFKGKNSPNWKGGVHDERWDRLQKPYIEWRTKVFQRDNYACTKCNKKSTHLEAHHILNWKDNPDERYELNNGITFCQKCHIKFHKTYGKKNNTNCQLSEFLQST